MERKPNIVLCICDQLRAFEVGCYGNDVIRTPNIDGLAAEGARFETAVSNYPLCMPARSVLLSGMYNRACTGGVSNVSFTGGRAGDFQLPEYPFDGRPHLKSQTLPEALKGLGYETAAIGKWHIHSWPSDIGFDSYLIPRVHHCHTGQLYTENGGPEFSPPGFSVDFECDRVGGFLEERQGADKPFFLYYSISPPHNPLRDAPERYLGMYKPEEIPLRPNVDLTVPLCDQEYWFRVYRWDYRYYSFHLPYTEPLPPDYDLRRLIADYYGLTTWVDDAVGRMLQALEAAGLSENTIVVFTSDHGDCLGSHGLVQKGVPTEESIRIPLIIRGPGIDAQTVPRVASLVDLMPTLLDMVGSPVPQHLQGRSLVPLVEGPGTPWDDDAAFIECGGGVAIRTQTCVYHLLQGQDRQLAEASRFFYDLEADPYQLRNLADEAHLYPVAKDLDERLRAWHDATP